MTKILKSITFLSLFMFSSILFAQPYGYYSNSTGGNFTSLKMPPCIPTALTSNTNNYNPGCVANVFELSSTTNIELTGWSSAANGWVITIINVGSNAITIKHTSGSSSTANQFSNGYGDASSDIVLSSKQSYTAIYLTSIQKWRHISSTSQSGLVLITGSTMSGTLTLVPGSIVSINAGGQIIGTANPVDTSVISGAIVANPAACGTNEILFGAAVNNVSKAYIDCEGDASFGTLGSSGLATLASLTVSGSLLANGGTILGATTSNPTQISGVLTTASAINNTFGIACTNGVTGSVCVQDDFSVNTGISVYGYFDTYERAPSALSGNVTDYTGCLGSKLCLIDSGGSDRNIVSLGNTGRGRHVTICATNATGSLTMKHDDGATGTASMRFKFNSSTDRVIAPDECRTVVYDNVASRWRESL